MFRVNDLHALQGFWSINIDVGLERPGYNFPWDRKPKNWKQSEEGKKCGNTRGIIAPSHNRSHATWKN